MRTKVRFCVIQLMTLVLAGFVCAGPRAEDITIDTDATWEAGTYIYDNMTISSSATLTANGNVEISAVNVTISSGSDISADGKGHGPGEGPGAGQPLADDPAKGSGGGHGGTGEDYSGTQGGVRYDSAMSPAEPGSGGGGTGAGAGGGVIRLITVSGAMDLYAPLSSPITGIRGNFQGEIAAALQEMIDYPKGFDPSTDSTADATDNMIGFGFKGEYTLTFKSGLEIRINNTGVAGVFNVFISFNGNAQVKWGPFMGVSRYEMSAQGNLTATQTSSALNVKGELIFSGGGEAEQAELDITI